MICSRLCNQGNYNNTISVTGLCEDKEEVNNSINNFPYWKEMSLQAIAVIPDTSPNIEYVNSVNIGVNIQNSNIIKTPRSSENIVNGITSLNDNLEGKIVTGRKIIIKGNLCTTIEYVTSDPYDNVRMMKSYNPFSTYIVIPRELAINGQTLDALSINFNIKSCIEDLNVTILNRRSMLNYVSILLYVIPAI